MSTPATPVEEARRLLLDEHAEVELALQAIAQVRRSGAAQGAEIERLLVETCLSSLRAARDLGAVNEEMRQLLRTLTAPPMLEGVILDVLVRAEEEPALARVAVAGGERVVTLASDLEAERLSAGDRVCLTADANAVLHRAEPCPEPGEVAVFERAAPGGRLVVRDRDQALVVRAAAGLALDELGPGDLVRLDRHVWMAMERLESSEGERYAASDLATALPLTAFAGYDEIRETALRRVVYAVAHPQTARAYGVGGDGDRILLSGPPGCGKTTLARSIAGALRHESGEPCRVLRVNGAELYSPWVGTTEQNIRTVFRDLRETAAGYAVLFLDEVDAIARIRGAAGNVHSDRFLNGLLAEMEGFDGCARLVLIAATNRADMLDPAFRERFTWEVEIPRPRMDSARAIFACHLGPTYPYRPNGASAEATRLGLVESALAQIYDPNAAGSAVATLRLRDGKTRMVTVRDLVSGRFIEQVCRGARARAFERHVEGGEHGITAGDLDAAIASAVERLRGTLTLANVHSYLTDLPHDVAVAAVEPAARAVSRRRYVA